MPLLPPVEKACVAAGGAAVCQQHEAAGRRWDLKKWLTDRVGSPRRRVGGEPGASALPKSRHSAAIQGGAWGGRAGDGGGGARKPELRGRQSLPGTARLHRKGTGGHGRARRPAHVPLAPHSPLPPPPPPSAEAQPGGGGAEASADASPADQAPKKGLPLRKRSLIYAMYCTAQPDEQTALEAPESSAGSADADDVDGAWLDLEQDRFGLRVSYSLASAFDASAIYASCQGLGSARSSQASPGCIPSTPSSTSPSAAEYTPSQPASDLSVGFMVVDVVNHLSVLQRCPSNANGGGSGCARAPSWRLSHGSSSSGSRSSCAEPQAVETDAYVCYGRYAPRLSTVERAHDGQLLLRPSMGSTPTASTHNPGSGDTEAESQTDAGRTDVGQVGTGLGSADHLPLAPYMPPRHSAETKPVDSLRIHIARAGAQLNREEGSLALPDEGADAVGPYSPLADAHRFSAMTPPESPEKPGMAATATGTRPGAAAARAHEEDKAQQHTGGQKALGFTATVPCCYYTPSSSAADEQGGGGIPAATGSGDAARTAYDAEDASPPAPPPTPLDPGCRESTYGSIELAVVGWGITDSAPASPMPGSEAQVRDAEAENSLLLGGCSAGAAHAAEPNDSARSATLDVGKDAPSADTDALGGGTDNQVDDGPVTDGQVVGSQVAGEMPLACVVPVYSAAAGVWGAPEPGLAGSAVAERAKATASTRSRKLVAALVRAAQLDGLRQLQRTIRPGGASDTTSSSNSSCSSSDGGGGNAGGNSHGDPRRQLVKRPSKVFRFNELVAVYETWDRDEYDRRGMPTARLDAELIEQIKQELNEFKTHEMRVHAESRANTHIIC